MDSDSSSSGFASRSVLLLEPVDTLDGETDGTGTVSRRRYTSLESVTESDESRVEEILTLFGENVGDYLGRVSLRSLLRSMKTDPMSVDDRFGSKRKRDRVLPDDETTFRLSGDILTVTLLEELDIRGELFESDTVLRSVNEVGTGLTERRFDVRIWDNRASEEGGRAYSKSTEHGDVTTSSSLSLDDEDTVPRSGSTLLDGVASFDENVD